MLYHLSATILIIFTHTEINQAAPVFAKDTDKSLTLSWNLPQGAVLAQFNATDSDVGPPGEVIYSLYHSYQLPVNVSSGEGIFSINNETGVLVLDQDLNITQGLYKRFVLFIVATDLGEDPQFTELTVSVKLEDTPAPIPSFDKDVYILKVSENAPGNSTILNFTCTEPEEATGASNLSTSLTNSSDSPLFSLEGEYNDIMLVLMEKRDYEALQDAPVPHYTLEVTCSNQYDITATATIKIEILNENDNSFEFENSTYFVVLPENVLRGYQVLSVTAFDPDIPDGKITYDAIDPDAFSIYSNGTIYVTESVDREMKDEYILNVEAKLLSSGEITDAVVSITISDINEGPPIFSNDLYVSENLTTANGVGDVALVVAAVDRDFGRNGSVVYSIEGNALFAINSTTGEVYINNADLVPLYGSYVFRVYATDEGDPPMNSTSRVDIYVAPIPNHIEFQMISYSATVQEDSPRGHEIVIIIADILDTSNGIIVDTHTVGSVEYELMPTMDYESFHVGRYSGKLILLNTLDYEDKNLHNLTVIASIPKYKEAVINSTVKVYIEVVDVNDNSPVFMSLFYTKVVEEFTESGITVLTVHATDADSGTNALISYHLEDDEVPFSVGSESGRVEVSDTLDTPLDYRFYVVAEDNGSPFRSSKALIFISVTHSLSIVPEFDRQRYAFTIAENSPPGSHIGTVLAQAAGNNSIDEYTRLEYRLHSPDPSMIETFHIDPDLGDTSVLAVLDAEQQDLYILYVEVHNGSHVFDNATIEIHVEDINDHAPQFKQSLYTEVITTSQPQHSVLFNVSADDGDESSSLIQYSFTESAAIGFGIDQTTGAVYVVNSTLFLGDYHLTAVATDEGEPPQNGTVLLFISVIPAGSQSIEFEETEYVFDISEDAEPGTSLGKVIALDHSWIPFPEGSNLRYRFSNTTPIHIVPLTIGPITGDVLVSSTLDREHQSSYTLVVIAEYEANQTGEVIMTVNVLDINDNPPIFTKDVYAEVIFTYHGNSTAIVQVLAADADYGENGTVQYSFSDGEVETDQFRITGAGEIYSLTHTVPAGNYRLTVVASDSNPEIQETSTATISIVCVVYQEPVSTPQITITIFEILENSPTGTEVGTVKLQAGGVEIVPANYEDNLVFSIGDEYFVINPSNGTLKVVGPLDRESQGSYSFEVSATFTSYNIFVVEEITVNVVDENDNDPVFYPLLYSAVIDDSYTDSQVIPTDQVLVTDGDEGTNAELELSLDENNPFGIRSISSSEGESLSEIYVQNSSLLEPDNSYIFNIIASDGGQPPHTASASVHIQVNYAVPDNIHFSMAHYEFTYTENSPMETVVGRVSVEPDTPALDGLVYSVSGGSGLFFFHIGQYSGEISNHFPMDREQEDEYNLTITAKLVHHSLTATTLVTVTVLDMNDNVPIFDRSSYSATVFADQISTTVPIISVSATDADDGSNAQIGYSINTNHSFQIVENGSIYAISSTLAAGTYTLTVEASDMGNEPQTGSTVVIIEIRQAIPNAITFSQTQYSFDMSESDISGTAVGVVELDPPLAAEFVQYRSFGTDSEDFIVVTQSGVVQSLRQFDYESGKTVMDFEVTCNLYLPHETPPVSLTATASVTVSVLDENDNTPMFIDFPTHLNWIENVTHEEVITVISAVDADSGTNAALEYSIVNDVLLRIDPSTGELFVLPGLDREQQIIHTVSVLVSDQGSEPNSYQSDITLTLLDINDNIPILVQSVFTVDERVSGLVFRLQYRDADDGEYGRANFHMLFNDTDERFSVNSASGDVMLTAPLDFEAEETVQFCVELVDNPDEPSNSNTPNYTVVVNVRNKPDNVPQFDSNIEWTLAIDPGIMESDLLIQVRATDSDNDAIIYTIESTSAGFIRIDSSTGEIVFTQSTLLTPGTHYEVVVKATDSSVYALSSTLVLSIKIDARSLTFEQEAYEVSIPEDAQRNHTVGEFRIQELARSNEYQYSFEYEVVFPHNALDVFRPWNNLYAIIILVNGDLDHETIPTYILEITATRVLADDPEQVERFKLNLTITIDDVNDNEPVIFPPEPLYSISEDAPVDTVITQVNATDSDTKQNKELHYSIIDPATSPFTIDPNNGTIRVQEQLDFEHQEIYTLTVKVVDLGEPPLSSTAQYTIKILNINDRTPGFAALAYFGELYAQAPANSDVKHVVLEVLDRDGDSEFSFSISPDPTDATAAGFALTVSSEQPYHIIANRIPSELESGLVKFIITVSDGMYQNQTLLYLGVFAQEHLLPVSVSGFSRDEFSTLIDTVLDALNDQLLAVFDIPVSYYYDSIEESRRDTTV